MTESKFKSIVEIIEANIIKELPDDVSIEIRKDGEYHVIEALYMDDGKFRTMKYTKYLNGETKYAKSFDGGDK